MSGAAATKEAGICQNGNLIEQKVLQVLTCVHKCRAGFPPQDFLRVCFCCKRAKYFNNFQDFSFDQKETKHHKYDFMVSG